MPAEEPLHQATTPEKRRPLGISISTCVLGTSCGHALEAEAAGRDVAHEGLRGRAIVGELARLADGAPRRLASLRQIGQGDLAVGIEAGRAAHDGVLQQVVEQLGVARVLRRQPRKLGVQLAHGEQRILAGASPGGGHREQMQGGGAVLADVVGFGEVAVERDARRREIVEELDDEAHRMLVEVRLQHPVAQDRDDSGLAGDVRAQAGGAAHRTLPAEGIDGAGDGCRQQRGRMHLADERFQHWHADVRRQRVLGLATHVVRRRKSCAAQFAERWHSQPMRC